MGQDSGVLKLPPKLVQDIGQWLGRHDTLSLMSSCKSLNQALVPLVWGALAVKRQTDSSISQNSLGLSSRRLELRSSSTAQGITVSPDETRRLTKLTGAMLKGTLDNVVPVTRKLVVSCSVEDLRPGSEAGKIVGSFIEMVAPEMLTKLRLLELHIDDSQRQSQVTMAGNHMAQIMAQYETFGNIDIHASFKLWSIAQNPLPLLLNDAFVSMQLRCVVLEYHNARSLSLFESQLPAALERFSMRVHAEPDVMVQAEMLQHFFSQCMNLRILQIPLQVDNQDSTRWVPSTVTELQVYNIHDAVNLHRLKSIEVVGPCSMSRIAERVTPPHAYFHAAPQFHRHLSLLRLKNGSFLENVQELPGLMALAIDNALSVERLQSINSQRFPRLEMVLLGEMSEFESISAMQLDNNVRVYAASQDCDMLVGSMGKKMVVAGTVVEMAQDIYRMV